MSERYDAMWTRCWPILCLWGEKPWRCFRNLQVPRCCHSEFKPTNESGQITVRNSILPSEPRWASRRWMSSVLCPSESPDWGPGRPWCRPDVYPQRTSSRLHRPMTDPYHSGSPPARSASFSASPLRSDPKESMSAGRQEIYWWMTSQWIFTSMTSKPSSAAGKTNIWLLIV